MNVTIVGTILSITDGSNKIVLDAAKFVPEIVGRLTMHGLKQKVVDAAAKSRDPKTGASASVAEKFASMQKVANALTAGDWGVDRESSESSYLFEAVSRFYGAKKTAVAITKYLDGLTPKQKTTLAKSSRYAPLIVKIRAERNPDAEKIAESMLADMDKM